MVFDALGESGPPRAMTHPPASTRAMRRTTHAVRGDLRRLARTDSAPLETAPISVLPRIRSSYFP